MTRWDNAPGHIVEDWAAKPNFGGIVFFPEMIFANFMSVIQKHMQNVTPFHIAIPVHNLAECRTFYREILDCEEGRSSDHWVDFNLFGHQLVIHYKPKAETEAVHHNPVDGHDVPVPHYGVVLPWDTFESFSQELKAKGVQFVIEPYIRFKGKAGEQATMFFLDPAGNALEFKAFKDMNQLFAV